MNRSDSLFGAAARKLFERQQQLRRRKQFEIDRDAEVEGPSTGIVGIVVVEEGPMDIAAAAAAVEAAATAELAATSHSSTQAAPPLPRHELRVLSGDPEATYELHAGETTIGRSAGSGIRLTNRSVSHAHAVIALVGGRITIRDTHSTNGTKVNDALIAEPTELADGDTMGLGDVVLALSIAGGQ